MSDVLQVTLLELLAQVLAIFLIKQRSQSDCPKPTTT